MNCFNSFRVLKTIAKTTCRNLLSLQIICLVYYAQVRLSGVPTKQLQWPSLKTVDAQVVPLKGQ